MALRRQEDEPRQGGAAGQGGPHSGSRRLAATSSGLQPYEIIVVTNKEVREKIKPIAWNQEQITDGSHLLVFAAWDNYTAERINTMFDLTNEQRGVNNEGWENYRQMLLAMYPQRDAEVNFHHAARQAYIGLGAALIAAAEERWTPRPWKASTPRQLDEILGCARHVACAASPFCRWATAPTKVTGW